MTSFNLEDAIAKVKQDLAKEEEIKVRKDEVEKENGRRKLVEGLQEEARVILKFGETNLVDALDLELLSKIDYPAFVYAIGGKDHHEAVDGGRIIFLYLSLGSRYLSCRVNKITTKEGLWQPAKDISILSPHSIESASQFLLLIEQQQLAYQKDQEAILLKLNLEEEQLQLREKYDVMNAQSEQEFQQLEESVLKIHEILQQETKNLERIIEKKVWQAKLAQWQWPQNKTLTLYFWKWCTGAYTDDETYFDYDCGWSLSDRLDEHGYVTLLDEKIREYAQSFHESPRIDFKKSRIIRLPENVIFTVERRDCNSIEELPPALKGHEYLKLDFWQSPKFIVRYTNYYEQRFAVKEPYVDTLGSSQGYLFTENPRNFENLEEIAITWEETFRLEKLNEVPLDCLREIISGKGS